MLKMTFLKVFVVLIILVWSCESYSAKEDLRIIQAFINHNKQYPINHALVARKLVHQSNWSSVGTISTKPKILGYPMVNLVAIDDSSIDGKSTGKIHFLLTNLDFTGIDWRQNNKVTFMFTDEQNLNCGKKGVDPMEPICPRTIISGKIKEFDKSSSEYIDQVKVFQKRHPAAKIWPKFHSFYLCELEIENIYVLDFYGGAQNVEPSDYYKVQL